MLCVLHVSMLPYLFTLIQIIAMAIVFHYYFSRLIERLGRYSLERYLPYIANAKCTIQSFSLQNPRSTDLAMDPLIRIQVLRFRIRIQFSLPWNPRLNFFFLPQRQTC